MTGPANNPDDERRRWELACITELIKHGGSANDLRQLREQFRIIRDNKELAPTPTEIAGDIPS
jgi:hypothetical protein